MYAQLIYSHIDITSSSSNGQRIGGHVSAGKTSWLVGTKSHGTQVETWDGMGSTDSTTTVLQTTATAYGAANQQQEGSRRIHN